MTQALKLKSKYRIGINNDKIDKESPTSKEAASTQQSSSGKEEAVNEVHVSDGGGKTEEWAKSGIGKEGETHFSGNMVESILFSPPSKKGGEKLDKEEADKKQPKEVTQQAKLTPGCERASTRITGTRDSRYSCTQRNVMIACIQAHE